MILRIDLREVGTLRCGVQGRAALERATGKPGGPSLPRLRLNTLADDAGLRHCVSMLVLDPEVEARRAWNKLAVALAISLLLHLSAYSVWKVGRQHGWWKPVRAIPLFFSAPPKTNSWLAKILAPPKPVVPREVPMIFTDVDPATAVKEPPKKTKYYGALNSEAASPKKSSDNTPQINGTQTRVIKATEAGKPDPKKLTVANPQPLQPTPEQPSPETQRKTVAPGNVSLGNPDTAPKTGEGTADVKSEAQHEEPKPRPRRLAEVQPTLSGAPMKQEGGTARVAMQSSFDVKATSFGDYDRRFIAAVQQCWESLLQPNIVTHKGHVVVTFRLHYDGRVDRLEVSDNNTTEVLGAICLTAISKPSPFDKWPIEMRRELNADYRDVRFTFYYD